ncbi:DUF3313 domain-containing protein [Acinetobacter baumannii]|uniref:DUF3313 domain-containing protein n=1 Tax=Acinetobacter baumannii TaxID=470 RepID=UPI0024497A8E|nr:DUF3313 domain-containing protein [Acinetobacter baumannii]MDH2498733.1 DUF3313 domain-containing protein [Acinetobacter baumannii]
MLNFRITSLIILSSSILFLGGCVSTTIPPHYTQLPSSQVLKPSFNKNSNISYEYSPAVHWNRYSRFLMEPIEIYNADDNQFNKSTNKDKQELATFAYNEFNEVLTKRFQLANEVGPNTLRIKITLTGLKTNTPIVSTFTRFDLMGGPINAIQSIRGKEGVFMGNVSYSIEIYDAESNQLLKAFISKQYPNAMNIRATLGRLSAAKNGIHKAAEELLSELN